MISLTLFDIWMNPIKFYFTFHKYIYIYKRNREWNECEAIFSYINAQINNIPYKILKQLFESVNLSVLAETHSCLSHSGSQYLFDSLNLFSWMRPTSKFDSVNLWVTTEIHFSLMQRVSVWLCESLSHDWDSLLSLSNIDFCVCVWDLIHIWLHKISLWILEIYK